MMLPATSSLHEVGYLIIGGAAALLTLGILALRVGDLLRLYRKGQNGERRALAWERLLACAGLLTFNLYMLWIAYRALSLPSPEWSFFYRLGVGFFYFTAAMMIALALFQWWIRFHPRKK